MDRIVLVFLLFVPTLCRTQDALERVRFDGHKIVSVNPENEGQLALLKDWWQGDANMDFWEEPRRLGSRVMFMVSPERLEAIENALSDARLQIQVEHDNIQQELDEMWKLLDLKATQLSSSFDYDDFNTYEEIMMELEALRDDCQPAGLDCEVYSIGKSYEGRDLKMLKISNGDSKNRKAVWIDSTIHAREWLTPATLMKLINQLIRAYNTDSDAQDLVNSYVFYMLPVVNPDGYVYTRTNRYWRKNRRPQNFGCAGVDLNRNFDFRWGTEGVSSNPCSDIFCGTEGGSEPETQAVQNELQRLGGGIVAMVTMHSYGNMWMFPWGTTVGHRGRNCDRASDHEDMKFVADRTADAIQQTYGTRWKRGNSCEVIYETSGGTDDYAKGVAGVKYSFCPELRGRNFVVNKSEINKSFNEFYNGIKAMLVAIELREPS
ncbi:hypothetical protein CAPTEDRAFT_219486 [Capitella teleta]|uniref:Peptidase M14 domain-containing protein n=1 Tax=Capitella teleta TaxID=283909 RepID=X2APM4_CAPTE|nr:hypothetical protein CAPTEDRAFT_219486 [Capitella teleta]|eukprot:ELU10131.1 hypothetical protein CAPTEDRAFT_219486 [Capitella teleta]